MDIDPERVARSPFVIGALGALVTAIKFMPGVNWWERLINVVAGSLAAGYVTPALVEWLKMPSLGYSNGAAFVIGLLGMSIAAAILQAIKETPLGQILTGWLQRRGQ